MGYDSTISVYDDKGNYLYDVVEDISFRAILNLIRFSKNKQLNDKELNNLCLWGDINCKVNVVNEFIDYCKKNNLMSDVDFHWDIVYSNEILKDESIKYFSITSI